MISANTISQLPTPASARTAKANATVRPTDPKIASTAREFEATFLSMLLKEMRQTLDPDEGGLFPGDQGDVQGGMFDLFLSQHLAAAGGFGMAAVLEKQLQPATHASDARTQPAAVDRAAARPPAARSDAAANQ